SPGHDFLAQLCQDWEAQTKPAREAGIRVIHMRTGVVLDKHGGALAKMLPAFQLGLGGVIGDGQQMMSWISLAEIPYIVEHMIHTKDLSGAVNVVSPQAVTNETFTKVLGSVVKRPTAFPVHPFMIRMILGEMGQKLLLEGSWVVPQKLIQTGYRFRYDDLSLALAATLSRANSY
ncbi:MAG: DUF1731 domain-containing protein, partial [Candidatus Omnitrophica bacterium]|nr:DUF1731 domain-containing protein [Candidatus Omnitrophota bacterium]